MAFSVIWHTLLDELDDHPEGATLITPLSNDRFRITDVQEQRVVIEWLDRDIDEAGDIDMELEADPGFNLKVDPEDLIDRIILPPDINDRQLTQVVQLMEYHDITAEIWRSMLDVSPGTTAPIQVTGDDAGEIARNDMRHARLVDKSEYN